MVDVLPVAACDVGFCSLTAAGVSRRTTPSYFYGFVCVLYLLKIAVHL